MFLAFVFLTLMLVTIGVVQFALHGNMQRNLAPAAAYAQNITIWHQGAMMFVNDIDRAAGFQTANCTSPALGGIASWAPPCVLEIPGNSFIAGVGDIGIQARLTGPAINNFFTPISPGYQRMDNWQSWLFMKANNEAYVITLYTPPPIAADKTHGYLEPDYISGGLKKDMGFDRSGVGVIRNCSPANNSCMQFNPLGYQNNQLDDPLEIRFDPNKAPANFTTARLIGSVGIMTRIQ